MPLSRLNPGEGETAGLRHKRNGNAQPPQPIHIHVFGHLLEGSQLFVT